MAIGGKRALTKRAYDARLFSVDVSGKLHAGDTVTGFTSITAEVSTSGADNPSALTVSRDSTPISSSGKILNFRCSGGASETTYLVTLRYTTTTETQLESVILVKVV